jgi:release factor glutamine methyltransferase
MPIMTIGQLLEKGAATLGTTSQTPVLDSEVLLAFVLSKNKAFLYANKQKNVRKNRDKQYLLLIERRRKREPIAYLTHKKEFYSLPFYVDENVLIPRPETEQLVDLTYKEVKRIALRQFDGFDKLTAGKLTAQGKRMTKSGPRMVSIIDVGTGCGNIGITIIHKILEERLNKKAKFTIYLTDISGKALKIAKKNLKRILKKRNGIKVHFVKTDLLKGVNKKFDIIVSNPPYIPKKQIEYLEIGVRDFEPRVALDGGVGGVEVLKRLITESIEKLDGVLLFELHERHPLKVRLFLEENYPKWRVKFFKDCFGQWRFAVIKRR